MQSKKNLNINRYDWAKQTISKIYKQESKEIILYDIGSRDAILKNYLSDKNIQYYGFDLDPLDKEVKKWDLEKKFSYSEIPHPHIITMLEVVEHLNNPGLCINNLSSLMKNGSYLLITTPNPGWSNSRLNFLFTGYLSCFTKADLDLNHHVFVPFPHIIEKLLNHENLKIIDFVTIDGSTKLFKGYKKWYKFFYQLPYRLIKLLIETLSPSSKGMSYAILVKKDG